MIGKRIFDVLFSITLLVLLVAPMLIIWIITSVFLKSNGLFFQIRIGQYGEPFTMYKYKTLYSDRTKISKWGSFLRSTKIDELPQIVNILKGDMSFVGPRPDLSGYYDLLEGENRALLKLKPGLTSEAALKYINEEQLLASQENPKQYNDEVIYPNKIKMNLHYYHTRSFLVDLKIILKTIAKSITTVKHTENE
jgi:lipopolysaccharide/colanic/teichoic acid biosynthesis glycosyltransferase